MVAPRLPFDQEICAVCGRETSDRRFMRVYLADGRLEFCSPACAQAFNDGPARFDAAARPGGLAAASLRSAAVW